MFEWLKRLSKQPVKQPVKSRSGVYIYPKGKFVTGISDRLVYMHPQSPASACHDMGFGEYADNGGIVPVFIPPDRLKRAEDGTWTDEAE